jgi:hypothetical protein
MLLVCSSSGARKLAVQADQKSAVADMASLLEQPKNRAGILK